MVQSISTAPRTLTNPIGRMAVMTEQDREQVGVVDPAVEEELAEVLLWQAIRGTPVTCRLARPPVGTLRNVRRRPSIAG